jgi:phosphoribosylformylglycinamidine synthase
MGISGIIRIEEFKAVSEEFSDFDCAFAKYSALDQNFTINIEPEAILEIEDIAAYNQSEGLALSRRVSYLD